MLTTMGLGLLVFGGGAFGNSPTEPPDPDDVAVPNEATAIELPVASAAPTTTSASTTTSIPAATTNSTAPATSTTAVETPQPVTSTTPPAATTTSSPTTPTTSTTTPPSTTTTVAPCPSPSLTASHAGAAGTTGDLAVDGDLNTYFESSFDDWQTLQINLGCVGSFQGLRRFMTDPGSGTSRGLQGEGVAYLVDGLGWIEVTADSGGGWNNYVNYGSRNHAWHSMPYGWSEWLTLTAPVDVIAVRFNWDGNEDRLNEIELMIDF